VDTATPAFQKAVAFILPHEEEFTRGHWGDENFVIAENVPGDSGGWTKYGIDASSHPGVDIKDLTRAQAIAIYWEEWCFRSLDALPGKLAIACFDVMVNGGFAIRWLQTALNKISPSTPLLVIDGDLGQKTFAAAQSCDQDAVLRYFINERDARFIELAKGPRAKFLAGWEQRDADLRKYLLAA
jgi:lysozyme family protein